MRQATRKGLMTVAAATGVIAAVGGGYAHADSSADGTASHSPGVLSGNSVQAPVHAPVNICGNTVDAVGALNPAMGNACVNGSDRSDGYGDPDAHAGSGSHAGGHTEGSPGVGSGNHVQVPVDVPVNVCGNSIDVIGIGNSATGNDCANHDSGDHDRTPPRTPDDPGGPKEPGGPGTPEAPAQPDAPGAETPGGGQPNEPAAQTVTRPEGEAQLAETGSGMPLGVVLPAGAGALLAGAVLYRRARASV